MKFTTDNLIKLGVSAAIAARFIEPLKAAAAIMDISTKARFSAFLGQVMVESDDFAFVEENLNYRAERILQVFPSKVKTLDQAKTLANNPKALANVVYADRLGNGNVSTGDGWNYRGRGLIQLTGKTNYQNAATGTGRPYVTQPDLLLQPSDACLSAAWFWHANKCNILADAGKIDLITKTINGSAMLKKEERAAIYQKALQIITD